MEVTVVLKEKSPETEAEPSTNYGEVFEGDNLKVEYLDAGVVVSSQDNKTGAAWERFWPMSEIQSVEIQKAGGPDDVEAI